MTATAKRTKRLEKTLKPKITNEQLVAFLSAGITASKERDYRAEPLTESGH